MDGKAQANNWKTVLTWLMAAGGGFVLSFVAMGALSAGKPWHYQALMFIPFLLLSFGVSRIRRAGRNAYRLIIYGTVPNAALILLSIGKDDSHVVAALMVCIWFAGAFLGHFLSNRYSRKSVQPNEASAG